MKKPGIARLITIAILLILATGIVGIVALYIIMAVSWFGALSRQGR